MGITIYTMGGEGEILEEEWQRGIQTNKKVIANASTEITTPSNITQSASMSKIIDASVNGANEVASKLTRDVIQTESDVVREAMQRWASQFEQDVQEEIEPRLRP